MLRFGIVIAISACVTSTFAGPASSEVLTLSQAFQLARESNPELIASRQRIEAARSRLRDANRRPNPSLGLSVENVGGSLGTDRTESTLHLEQLLELGGDRSARSGLGRSLEELARAEAASLEREVLVATADRFLQAWSLQERGRHLRAAERAASAAVVAAQDRLRAGAAPAFELVRAQAFRSLRIVERARVDAEVPAGRRRLALQWGASEFRMDSVSLEPPDRYRVPDGAAVTEAVSRHPERMRAIAQAASEEWRVREVKAARIPDLTISAGVRHLADVDGTGFIAEVSMPIQLWNSQKGGVAAAEFERSAAHERARSIELRLGEEIRGAAERYGSAFQTWQQLGAEVVPASREALRLVENAYRSGRLSYVDILDTQRNLLDTELALIEATVDLWRAGLALSLLVEAPIPGDSPEEGTR